MYIIDESFESNKKKNVYKVRMKLPEEERAVYKALEPYARSIGDIADEVGLEFRKAIETLVELSIKGLAEETGKGYYVRVKDVIVT